MNAIKHSIKQLKTFRLFSCLMGDVLYVWTAVSNMFGAGMRTTLAKRLVYPLFDRCLIKHVLTVGPLTSTSACLVTKQCLMFGRQTFPV